MTGLLRSSHLQLSVALFRRNQGRAERQLESQGRRSFLINHRGHGGWDCEANSCFPQTLSVEEGKNEASHPFTDGKTEAQRAKGFAKPPSDLVMT